MHYNIVLSQAYPLAAGLTRAQAQKRAKTLLKELHDNMEAGKSKQNSTSPLDFPPDMPNLFHLQHLRLQNVEPVYSDGQVHPAKPKLVEYWNATFYHRMPVGKGTDGKTIYATTAGQYLSFTFKKIIHSLDAQLLPIYTAATRALQLPHGAVFDATTAVVYRLFGNVFLPVLRTTEGEVPMCEGAVRGDTREINKSFRQFKNERIYNDMNIWLAFDSESVLTLWGKNEDSIKEGKEFFRKSLEVIFKDINQIEACVTIVETPDNLYSMSAENDFTVFFVCHTLPDEVNGFTTMGSTATQREPVDYTKMDIDGACFVSVETIRKAFEAPETQFVDTKIFISKVIHTAAHELNHALVYRAHRKFSPLVSKEERKIFSYFSNVFCSHDDSDTIFLFLEKISNTEEYHKVADVINIPKNILIGYKVDYRDAYQRVNKYYPEFSHFVPPVSSYPTIEDWDKAEYKGEIDFENTPSLRLPGKYSMLYFYNYTITEGNGRSMNWSKYLQKLKQDFPYYCPIYYINPIDKPYIEQWKEFWKKERQ